jgi:hypothetical protein
MVELFSFKYDAIHFELSFGQSTGKHHVLLVLDGDFDPDGPDSRVFHDVATHVLTTCLGRIPETLAGYRFVPARLAHGRRTRPLFELADAWLNAPGH